MKTKAIAVISAVYDRLGDPRSKNALIFLLLALTAFGVVAPETATRLRDLVLSMAL
jgi:hypothetical protein